MIDRSKEFNDFKSKEFRGDALLKFIASDIFIKMFPDFTTASHIPKIEIFLRNKTLMKVASECDIKPHPEEILIWEHPETGEKKAIGKPLANAVEAHIYGIFETEGLQATYDFIQKYLFTEETVNIVKSHFKNEHNKEGSKAS